MNGSTKGAFRFKGDRTYVHGTDIYRRAVAEFESLQCGAIARVQMSLNQVLRVDADLWLVEGDALPPEMSTPVAGVISALVGEVTVKLYLTPSERSIGGRYEYDDSQVARQCELHEQSIDFSGSTSSSSIETTVAIAKRLHHERVSSQGKWLWSKLTADTPLPAEFKRVRVAIERCFGNRLTKCSIEIDGKRLGSLGFSLLEKQ